MATATVNPTCYHVSASSIGAFKDCPTRFRLAYREGLRPAKDTDSQRQGTNWHAMHEVYANEVAHAGQVATEIKEKYPNANDAAGAGAANGLDAVVSLLNDRYTLHMPVSKTAEEWALEREILLTSFIGYQWYWQNDPIKFLASELPFELPIHLPRTHLPLPTSEALRVGKIDHVVKWQGAVCALERKSTSRTIAPDSDYWEKAAKDTQVSMYALAFRDLMADCGGSRLMDTIAEMPLNTRYGNTLYDVWHKPTIKPCELTQKETAALVETGQYYGVQFCCSRISDGVMTVDGSPTPVIVGKKGYAIRETIPMYGARLLADIYERPEFYFQRKEIARTDQDLRSFEKQLFAVYTSMKSAARLDAWVENERQCRATFACPYIPICYGPGADAVCDGHTTPDGYKRIFVDLTVNGETLED